ncbi:unnamed protein product (macronuclear) [Paramecium tetraurelia]|uniref:Uncharacterized protein n=1 Tax=Paramecium tetraurelia TaxID=5888 RepID=A0DQY6_PARTE|nr:uncharacterized protein GSPATT00002854001 [Paramecium tetraurelia]CAK85453.1 unnamed protein product [Paramecium tetraurelia]|eukprot:XP_001452850.1 hypothetical protein (macronuclear) [Paramecium tetraurelia strain d4-2]
MSKLFKYKKVGNSMTIITKDSIELMEQLRTEHSHLCKSISELEMKRQLIEDKMRELSIKLNSTSQPSDQPDIPKLIYKFPCDSQQDQRTLDEEEVIFQTNDYQEFIPDFQASEMKTKKELFNYFSYKADVKDLFNDLNDANNLKKLAEEFGIKSNNNNKMKQQVQILQNYLSNQSFPSKWNNIYNTELFDKLEI